MPIEVELPPIKYPYKKEVEMTKRKAKRSVLLPDIHYPYQDKPSVEAVFQFLEWFKPDEVILLGDAMDMTAASHWLEDKNQRKTLENKRIMEEYDGFSRDILTRVELAAPRTSKLIYMGGNHEQWAYDLVEKDPRLEGLVEPEIVLHLEQRGWKWIPYLSTDRNGNTSLGTYKIGKLLVFHGIYTNKYHAAKTAETFSCSVAYGHTHDRQVYTKVHIDNPRSFHTAQSIGCLAQKAPAYLRGRANRWVNAFGVVYSLPNGDYTLYVPIIIRGKFVFANKVFGG